MAGPRNNKDKAPKEGGGDRQIDGGALSAPGLQVIGGPAGGAPRLGGMRSPLFGGNADAAAKESAAEAPAAGAKGGAKAPAAAKPQPEGGGGDERGGKREVSGIKGVSQFDAGAVTNATHLSHVMFDRTKYTQRNWAKIVAGLVVAGVIGAMIALPDLRRKTWKTVKGLKDGLVTSVRYQKKPRKKQATTYKGRVTKPGSAAATSVSAPKAPKGNCGKLLQLTAGVTALKLEERIAIAECHMMVDAPQAAEGALKPLVDKIVGMPEKELNKLTSHLTMADAMHSLVNAYLKQGKQREADSLLRRRCATWAQTNTCVAKAMVLADRRIANAAGIDKMFATRGSLDGKAQARLWLAGAQMSLLENKVATADQRYIMALTAAPRDALWVRKQIYETQALDLYNRGEVLRLKQGVDAALVELQRTDKAARTKLTLFKDLANPRNKARTVKTLLTREEITYRVKQDLDLIDILGPDSLRFGYEADFLRLLKRTSTHFADKGRGSSTQKRLAMWQIRAHLSKEEAHESTLTTIDGFERDHGKDVFSHHMRGVVYAGLTGNDRYFVLAAQEFQAALRLKSNWESLYGLGVSLVRAKKKESVPAVIRDLDRAVSTKGQKYWAEMLKAEYYLFIENYASAQKILADWLKQDPDHVTAQRLLVQLYAKKGQRGEADNAQLRLDERSRAEKFSRSREGFASPLGVMALGKRPLE